MIQFELLRELGQALKDQRKRAGLRPQDVCARIQDYRKSLAEGRPVEGLGVETYTAIEQGRVNLTLLEFSEIVSALGCSLRIETEDRGGWKLIALPVETR